MKYLPILFLVGCSFFEVPQFPQGRVDCKPNPSFWRKTGEARTGKVTWVVVPYRQLQEQCPTHRGSTNACIHHWNGVQEGIVWSWLSESQAKQWVTPQCESVFSHEMKHHLGFSHD